MNSNLSPIIYDAHSCPPFALNKNLSELRRYKASKVTFVSLNAGFGNMASTEILPILHHFRTFIFENSTHYHLAHTVNEIETCKAENKLAIGFDLEGINALDGNIDMLDQYNKLGVKQILLAYNKNNAAGGGCQDNDTGLTQYGKSIVKRMNEIGMIVDCSHTGYQTTLDIMETSLYPVVFSHSNSLSTVK